MIGLRPLLAGSVIVALTLAGCASSGETTVAPTSSPSPNETSPVTSQTPTPTNSARTITVTIQKGKINPPPGRVRVSRGEKVQIVVTSDEADEVHVHGYDLEKPLRPGKPTTIEFTADQPGLFEVETHELDKVLFQLQVE
jgi:plastocyanin